MAIGAASSLGSFAFNFTANTQGFTSATKTTHEHLKNLGYGLLMIHQQLEMVNNGLSRTQNVASSANTSMLKLGVTLGVVSRAARAFYDMVDYGDKTRFAMERLERTFGSMATTVREDLGRLNNAFAMPANELNDLSAKAGRAFMGMGVSKETAAQMTVQAAGRAMDLAAEGGMSPAEAMEAIIDAARNGGGALRDFGVEITEAEVHMAALARGFVRANHAITDQEKAIARFDVAMKGTAFADGLANANVDRFSASMNHLWVELEDLGAVVGESLAPVLADLADVAADLVHAFADLWRGMQADSQDIANQLVGWWMGVDPNEIAKVLAEDAERNRAERAQRADRFAANRVGEVQKNQQQWLFHHGARRSSIEDFAKELFTAGYRQKSIGEQQLDVQKKQLAELRKQNDRAAAAAGIAAGPAGDW